MRIVKEDKIKHQEIILEMSNITQELKKLPINEQ